MRDVAKVLAALLFLAAGVALVLLTTTRPSAPPAGTSSAVAPETTAPPPQTHKDLSDLAQDEQYLKENRTGFKRLRGLLRYQGLTCPAITHMWAKGISPLGQKFEILCGPPGSGDAYPALHYAVYPERGLVSVCQPFGASWGDTCS